MSKPARISVTDLCSYMYCTRKLYLAKVLKIFEPPKDSLVKGSIRHSTMEILNDKEEQIVTAIQKDDDYVKIRSLYLMHFKSALRASILSNKNRLRSVSLPLIEAYNQIIPFLETDASNRASRIFDFMQENNLFGAQLWENLVPKIKSEVKIVSEKYELSGIIDQLHVYREKVIPFELKTGKAPRDGPWPGHKIQIGAYLLLLEDKFGSPFDVGTVYYLDSDVKFDVVMNPFLKDEIITIKDSVKSLLLSKEIPKLCESPNKCAVCMIKEQCHKL